MYKDISVKMGLLLACVGSAFFPIVYFCLRQLLKKPTAHLPDSRAVVSVVAMRLTSILQALMSSCAGLIAIYYCRKDLVNDRHWIIDAYTHFGLPYMLYDIIAMCDAFRQEDQNLLTSPYSKVALEFFKKNWLMVLHHLGLAFICLPILLFFRNEKGAFFIGCMFTTELSTPFVGFRAVMKKIRWDKEHTSLYFFVSLMLLVTFFVFRILNFPFMYWIYGQSVGLSVWQVPPTLALKCNLTSGLIFLFQCWWFYLILKAGSRMLTKRTDKSSSVHSINNGSVHHKSN